MENDFVHTIAALTEGKSKSILDPESGFCQQYVREAALRKHLTECPQLLSLVYKPYMSMGNAMELPSLVVEHQPEQHLDNGERYHNRSGTNIVRDSITRVSKLIALNMVSYDSIVHGDTHTRHQQHAQKKWFMAHDGRYGSHDDNKIVSKSITQFILRHCENSREILTFLEQCTLHGVKTDDMCDAFLMAMHRVMLLYKLLASAILPRRKPNEKRSKYPILDQLKPGTVFRAFGGDPAVKNIGFCLVELCGMRPVPQGYKSFLGLEAHEPEPVFRILLMQLVSLDSPWDDQTGHAIKSFVPSEQAGPLQFKHFPEDRMFDETLPEHLDKLTKVLKNRGAGCRRPAPFKPVGKQAPKRKRATSTTDKAGPKTKKQRVIQSIPHKDTTLH
jgi:hypothetical protein